MVVAGHTGVECSKLLSISVGFLLSTNGNQQMEKNIFNLMARYGEVMGDLLASINGRSLDTSNSKYRRAVREIGGE